MITHVVWDWNGTLFADAEAMMTSTIDAFHRFDLPPVTIERYRALHTQPIDTFYDRLFGQTVPAGLRQQLHAAFHEAYQRRRPDLGLDPGAHEALRQVDQAGLSQSLLSMHPHETVAHLARHFALTEQLVRIDGQQGPDAGFKQDHLATHLQALDIAPDSALLIGDSVDDARAAHAVGTHCVLYASGLHTVEALHAENVPVTHSLPQAVTTGINATSS